MKGKDNFKTGMAAEYFAACYFTEQGYTVYWPMESQSRDDFIVTKEKEIIRVQVKKASWNRSSGRYDYLQCRLGTDKRQQWASRKNYTKDDCDVIVFVSDERELWVAPIEEVQSTTNICLKTTNPNPYKSRKKYNPENWKVL